MSSALRFVQLTRTACLYTRPIHSLCFKTERKTFLDASSNPIFKNVMGVRAMSLQQNFEEAKTRLGKLSQDPGNETKLSIYGLFKQATEGPVQSKRPGMMDFVARAKWDAWNTNGNISKEEAQQKYIDLVNSLVKGEEGQEAAQQESGQKYKNLLVECDGGLRKITLNRPSKKNAITWEMYGEWVSALKDAEEDPKTVVTAITGAGSYYCSGNDLSNFTNVKPDQMKQMAKDGKATLQKFVGAFIDFPKPLAAVINGPAVGIPITILGLFDLVYATDKATFHTPFSALGQSPEGASSFTYPRRMGYANASELLLFNQKITADEAARLGIVTKVFPDESFQAEVWPRLKEYSKLPVNSLIYSKELLRALDKESLHKINKLECERLEERWLSDDCINAIMAFFNRKKK